MDDDDQRVAEEKAAEWFQAQLDELDRDDAEAASPLGCAWSSEHYLFNKWDEGRAQAEILDRDDVLKALGSRPHFTIDRGFEQNKQKARDAVRLRFKAARNCLVGYVPDDDAIGGKWAMIYAMLKDPLPKKKEDREAVAKEYNRKFGNKPRPGGDKGQWPEATERAVRDCVRYLEDVRKSKLGRRKSVGK